MNFDRFSESGLRMLHDAVRKALDEDDQIPKGQPKQYEVRELPDWKEWADDLETTMSKRGIQHRKINWI